MHDIDDVCEQFRHWRQKYNSVRLHEALGMKAPCRGLYSKRLAATGKIIPWEYGGEYQVIKVNSWGYVHFDKWQICLSQTMIDQCIEFRRNPDRESFSACFRNFRSAELKIENGELIHRKITRL